MIHRNTYVNAPATPRADVRDAQAARALLRRPDVGRRGLRGVGGLRAPGRPRRGLPRARRGAASPSPRTPRSAPSAATSRAATPSTTSPPTSPSACCPSCRSAFATRRRRRLALAERALGQPRASSSAALGRAGVRAGAAPPPSREPDVQAEIAAFLRHLDRERNASPHTVRAYGDDLAQFAATRAPSCGRDARARRTSTTCSSAPSSPASTARASRRSPPRASSPALRTFFRYLCREGVLDAQPRPGPPVAAAREADPDPPRRGARSPRSSTCPATATPAVRGRAILELLYATGHPLRRARGPGPRRGRPDARMVRVLGKGRKERIVPFGGARRGARSRPTCPSAARRDPGPTRSS